MPVHIRPDEESPVHVPQMDDAEHRALVRQAALNALRTCAGCAVLGGAALAMGLRLLRPAILAADRLRDGSGDYWQELWMPAVLFGFFGLTFGGFTAWRLSSAAGIGGVMLCVLAGLAAVLVAGAGAVSASMIFAPVPAMAWIVLAVMTVAAIAGAFLFAAWSD
jgi:hypothetical protein